MSSTLILASGSEIRAQVLRQARVSFTQEVPRVDEDVMRDALLADEAKPRDIADALAEMKARKISEKFAGAQVLGCDQVLDHRGVLFSKPVSQQDALRQLKTLSGDLHTLLSAAVICQDGAPIWRHIGVVRLRMHTLSDAYLEDYVDRNWQHIRHTVGAYQVEQEGARLFSRIDGDYFTVLGLPLLDILSYLALRGDLER